VYDPVAVIILYSETNAALPAAGMLVHPDSAAVDPPEAPQTAAPTIKSLALVAVTNPLDTAVPVAPGALWFTASTPEMLLTS
jgi:hypothetical protein